ncbi:nucleotide-binding domain-containing protein [Sorangium sp. So ce124]|uniref:nucleotide-binding domain-containing protein n=1 Tax=Sorangium sp. So ce124 TaxID=3133280 RepID=UPI003F6411DC
MTILKAVNKAYDRYYGENDSHVVLKTARARNGFGSAPGVILDESKDGFGVLARHYEIQEALRPLFGKGSPVEPSIGDHPDFEHLRAPRTTEYSPITTLFMDMEGSTRLGLIYDPEKVFRIKNAVIRAAIDIIKSFDGHVHRIMGDAVMAYFGSRGQSVENGAIDALNCAATLRALFVHLVDSQLPEMANDQLGIRVGVDYGPKEKVLWGPYGYPGMEEVTATSFHVDVASKLQHAAGRNQIMIGHSLRSLLDVPDLLLEKKTVVKNGETREEPYVLPNYLGADGMPVNYRKYLLKWEAYLATTKLASAAPTLVGLSGEQLRVNIGVVDVHSDASISQTYQPSARMLPKRKQLMFDVQIPCQLRLPIAIDFRVENHGTEAGRVENNGDHSDRQEKTRNGDLRCVHWESTLYRGLHYLNIMVSSQGKRVLASRLGIWVE